MRRLVLAAGLALGLSLPASASEPNEPAPDANDSGVVVSTERPAPRNLNKQERREQQKIVRDLARELTGRPNPNRMVSRFYRPLCLAVAGVRKRYVADFSDRILDNAEKAGIELAGENCKPNAMVVFASQSRNELREVRRKNPNFFGDLGPDSFRTLVRSRDEAFAWRTTQLVDIHGRELGIETLMGPTDQGASYVGLGMQMPRRIGISGAVVVIDRDSTEGMTALQLADYATLRLLTPSAEIKDEIEGAPQTIMSLFRDTPSAPRQLTEFDLAYLNAVYTLRPPFLVPNKVHSAVIDAVVGE